ncbi:hypothetical protein [Sphingomonas solaris]|uniref:Energy transducer TonB n=1 Tax=Alterirhizorhabdus solaris TaxID=2529389 RepID=A0A558QYX4_9SPHN|nr:hypothetical protein [Sphingomonas solaris]TVV72308.1 hypothetical protein FOY91_14890 [Sphingomonas solaris]
MHRAAPLALLLAAACAGRTPPPHISRPDPEAARVIASAADQVRRCYRAPRAGRGGRGIVTVLRVAYAPDGMLAELPAIVTQSGVTADNSAAAGPMAEAAVLAVVRCAPVRLPAAQYRGGWNSFELTFSPRAVA